MVSTYTVMKESTNPCGDGQIPLLFTLEQPNWEVLVFAEGLFY